MWKNPDIFLLANESGSKGFLVRDSETLDSSLKFNWES